MLIALRFDILRYYALRPRLCRYHCQGSLTMSQLFDIVVSLSDFAKFSWSFFATDYRFCLRCFHLFRYAPWLIAVRHYFNTLFHYYFDYLRQSLLLGALIVAYVIVYAAIAAFTITLLCCRQFVISEMIASLC